uniref:Uncharacterized protein n=1 Tax=Rhizophora mucronata TaxID=61149 RepID=A0A2P2NS14_RHIMU
MLAVVLMWWLNIREIVM